MSRKQSSLLPDGHLHLSDGPIDLIIGVDGNTAAAYQAAERRFTTILDELCAELSLLRSPTNEQPHSPTARRMWRATLPHAASTFITPMAAVAGAVAEEVLAAMTAAAQLTRAYVNNGGDIALHLSAGQQFEIGLVDRPDRPSLFAQATITADDPVRGLATSGWRGRSFSLGIADAVTVLAETSSAADAAATIIANAVDLPGHPAITRIPAHELMPDTDLGTRPVTRDVKQLTPGEISTALSPGIAQARAMIDNDLITACALHLQGVTHAEHRSNHA